MRLIALFVLLPMVELALLLQIGKLIGLVPTIALIVATGVLGASLARHQGLATLDRMRSALAEGRLPHREIVEGVLILVAGAVLLTPGVLTDIAGFSLLVPEVRRLTAQYLLRRFENKLVDGATAFSFANSPQSRSEDQPGVVDVEYRVADTDD
jgi:UPF0716 protein FxsA